MIPLLIATLIWANPSDDEALQRTAHVQDAAALGVGRRLPNLTLAPLGQQPRSLDDLLVNRHGVALIMTSCGCPLSRRYAAHLAALEDQFKKTISFAFVNTVSSESTADMREQIREYGFDGLYLPDRDNKIVRAVGARTTTEVFLIDKRRAIAYRGAVDDQYGVGTALAAARHHYLRDALGALIDGKRPPVQATWSPGCLLDTKSVIAKKSAGESTYYGRISAILANRCVGCHRRGGVAPFSLESYGLLRGRASMMEAVIRDGIMPPWHGVELPGDDVDPWVNGRALQPEERDVLLAWLGADLPIGEGTSTALAPLSQTWTIGRPDLLLSSSAVTLPASGPMQYHRLVVPLNLAEDHWLSAFEFRPGKPDSVHHAIVWLLQPNEVLPTTTEVPHQLTFLGTYSPGDSTVVYPEGVARLLPAGALLIVDLYALPMGEAASTRLRVGLNFSPTWPEFRIDSVQGTAPTIDQACMGGVSATAFVELGHAARLVALSPIMRARGRTALVSIMPPDAASRPLLTALRYDYRWQIRYELAEPLDLPAGTRLMMHGTFDFSKDNPNSPGAPPAAPCGPAPNQETLLLAIEFVTPAPAARAR